MSELWTHIIRFEPLRKYSAQNLYNNDGGKYQEDVRGWR